MKINLRACRICLRVQSKTLPIFKNGDRSFADSIFLISGISIEPLVKNLPQRMCRSCCHNISKAIQVREVCIKSDEVLKSALPKRAVTNEIHEERPEIKEEYIDSFLEDFAADNGIFLAEDTSCPPVSDTKSEIKQEDDSDSMDDNLLALLGEKEEDFTPEKKPLKKRSKANGTPKPRKKKIDEEGYTKKKKKPMDPAREYSFQCLFCGKFMKTPSSLKAHEQVVHQEHFGKTTESLKCFCDICGAVLGKKAYLKAHMKSCHIKVKQFNCVLCQKGFSKRCLWIQHQMMHNNQFRFQCSYCAKGFVKKGRLDIHIRIHTGERPFKCEICDKTYAHDTDLRRHIWSHEGKKPYSCTLCSKGFIKKSSLSLHMRTHTGDKGLNCTLCSKTFTTRQTYIFHSERCGKKSPTQYISESDEKTTK